MKYKNISDQELTMPNVGIIKANSEFEFDGVIENNNIIKVEKKGK